MSIQNIIKEGNNCFYKELFTSQEVRKNRGKRRKEMETEEKHVHQPPRYERQYKNLYLEYMPRGQMQNVTNKRFNT